jgi:predicted RecB family endonuclease
VADPPERGRKLEAAVNTLFRAHSILIREAFRLASDESGAVLEQIDGVIELDGHLYLVEVKWRAGALTVDEISRHLIRIYHRGQTRGLFITATELTEAALKICREALQKTVVSIALLEELVLALEHDMALADFFRTKVHAAQMDREPFHHVRPR